MIPSPDAVAHMAAALQARWEHIATTEAINYHLGRAWEQLADAALTVHAQAHPDCHPAALCNGPEQRRLEDVGREQVREINRLYRILFDLIEEIQRWRASMGLETPVLHAAREALVRLDCARVSVPEPLGGSAPKREPPAGCVGH